MPPNDLRDILGGPGKIPKPPAEVAIGLPAELLRRRPDIRAAELQAAAQSAQIGVAQADLYPAFTLAGSVGVEASDIGDLFTSGAFTGVFNPSITLPIFNYGRIKNNVRVQDARLQELIVNYQNTVLNAYLEVENALVGFLPDPAGGRLPGGQRRGFRARGEARPGAVQGRHRRLHPGAQHPDRPAARSGPPDLGQGPDRDRPGGALQGPWRRLANPRGRRLHPRGDQGGHGRAHGLGRSAQAGGDPRR